VKIKTVHLDDNHNPKTVEAEMTIEEAALIQEWSGRSTTDGTSSIYNAMTTAVFNPYWSDGVDGYRRGDDE
jgi:hypothetical protein